MLKITMKTDNSAFDGEDLPLEVGRILHKLAATLERELSRSDECHDVWTLRDINGNRVGECEVVS